MPLLLDDSDRHEDDVDADRRKPVGHGAPSDLKLLADDEPEPIPCLCWILQLSIRRTSDLCMEGDFQASCTDFFSRHGKNKKKV